MFLILISILFYKSDFVLQLWEGKSSCVMWWYHVDTGTALHVLLDVTSLHILYPTVFSIKASGLLVMLLLYMLLLKLRNSCRLSLQMFSKDARQIYGTWSLGLKFNQSSLLSCSNCRKIFQSQILKLHWNSHESPLVHSRKRPGHMWLLCIAHEWHKIWSYTHFDPK